MEHLTKQQIVLLTLFTTFVTSIATGIVTVSLMDQAPPAATGTIERVIEQTVNQVASGVTGGENSASASASASAASAFGAGSAALGLSQNPLEAVENATAIAGRSLVRIKLLSDVNAGFGASDNSKITGLGVIVSKGGLIITDKSTIVVQGNYVAILPDGHSLPVAVLQSQNDGDIVFLLAEVPTAASSTTAETGASNISSATTETFTPITFAPTTGTNAPALGEAVITLSGIDSTVVNQGIIKKINTDASSSPTSYVTNIDPLQTLIGSPLFDLSGNIIGLQTFSLMGNVFYPVGLVKAVIPALNGGK
jgi:hypothetical protein